MPFVLPIVWNGQPILPMPTVPGRRTVELTMSDSVAAAASPWTRQRYTYDWMADWWEASVTLPPLTLAQAGAWTAWLAALRGQVGIFWLGHPLYKTPQGPAGGTPVVSGAGQTGRTLSTTGWTANAANVLLPGDYFQIGVRLHMVLVPVNTGAGGSATISIWPRIRESQPDQAPINVSNPQGLFALPTNTRKFTASETRMFGVTFDAVEAL